MSGVHNNAARTRGAAMRGRGVWLLGALSCLPRKELDSYSRGEPEVAPGAAPQEATAESDSDATLEPSELQAEPGTGAVADTAADCAECPALPLSRMGDAGAFPGEDGEEEGIAPAEVAPAESDADAEPSPCGPGALLSPGERCFFLETQPSSWGDARAACTARGAGWDLATVDGPDENDWLVGILGDATNVWLGATDRETEGRWVWVGDDEPFWTGGSEGSATAGAYVNWNGGDNPEPNGRGASDCLRMRADGVWADIECDTAFASLCEGPP